ncbi:MAG: CarD family transcriptional regulator, partial [Planctomycetota bacterium]
MIVDLPYSQPVDLYEDKIVCEIVSRLKQAKGPEGALKVDGTWGSFAPMLAAHISGALKRPILYVNAHLDEADRTSDDLQVFKGAGVEIFPVWEGIENISDATDEIGSQRLRLALGLARAEPGELSELIICAPIQALNQPVPGPGVLIEGGLTLGVKQTIEPELIIGWLSDNGFERVDSVDVPGQFARRGGIIDIFAPVTTDSASRIGASAPREAEPVRVEFFGDMIESIRRIDLDTQRSTERVESVCIVAGPEHGGPGPTELFVNLLPSETVIILEEPVDIADISEVFIDRSEGSGRLYPFGAIYKAMNKFTLLEISRFGGGSQNRPHLDVTSAQQFEHKTGAAWTGNKAVLAELLEQTDEKEVLLYCENPAQVQRITEIVVELRGDVPANFKMPVGFIHQGFIINSLNTIVVGHHEIFGQYALRRRIRKIRSAAPVESLVDLQKGDYVVHVSHGIGKFQGIRTIEKNGAVSEYLTIEYADKVLIHVPVVNISLVQKFIGSLPKRPPLSKIGGKKWARQKEKVAEGVKTLAAELLETHAKRQSMGGFSFGADSTWLKEFEESFIYQETPDQLTAIEHIKGDMIESVPMDRL